MEKLNLVRRQCPCNKSTQENEKQNTYTSVVIPEAKTVFLEKGRSFFLYTVFLFNLIIWSPCALQSTCHHINLLCVRKIFA